MPAIQTSSHHSFKFLYIIIFMLCASDVRGTDIFETDKDNGLSTVDPKNESLRSMDSTWQGGSGESGREGRLFFPKDSRLFGARRRIQFALLPIMFKLGVISTLLVGLTVMMSKGLTIGVILLFFALAHSLLKYKHQQYPQPVHLHLHGGDHNHPPPPPIYHHGYSHQSWDRASEEPEPAPAYENYNPGSQHNVIPYRYPYRYPYYDPQLYHGR